MVFVPENSAGEPVSVIRWQNEGAARTGYDENADFSALADGAYTLRVTAMDLFGNEETLSVRFFKDSAAPDAPDLTASPIPGKIDLRWTTPAAPDVIGYNVYSADSEDGDYGRENYYSLLTERAFTYPEYAYDYMTPGASRWFKIGAVDRAGNETLSVAVMGTAGKYNPTVHLTDEDPLLGNDVEINFSGFRANEYVYFYLDRSNTTFASEYSYDSTTEYSVTLSADGLDRGAHTVRAVGQESGATALARFTVNDLTPTLTLSAATVTQDGVFTATLAGFPQGKYVYFFLDPADNDTNNAPYTYYTSESNAKTLYLSSFGNPGPGVYTLRAVEPESGLTAMATLTVTAPQVTLRCETEKVSAGEYVYFYAAGVSDGAKLLLNGISADDYGYNTGSECEFYAAIPDNAEGVVLATVVDESLHRTASITLPVTRSAVSIELPQQSVGMEQFTIRGSGFKSSETVRLYVDGVEKNDSSWHDGTVSFNYSFDYNTAAGRHAIELRGADSGMSAVGSVVFADTAQSLTLSGAPTLGAALTLYAEGFRAGENVTFYLNGTEQGSGNASDAGNAQYTITSLTESPASGSYAFTAVGATSGRVAFYGIANSSNGNLTLNYSGNPRSGGTVTLSVEGLEAGETADVYVGNRALPTVTADNNGAATASIPVAAGDSGILTVTVRGESSQLWGRTNVPVNAYEPTLTVTPDAPVVGGTLTVQISGYRPGATGLAAYLDNKIIDAAVTTDTNGTASVSYTLPRNTATGEHVVCFFDPVSGDMLRKTISVAAYVPVLNVPESAASGETVTLGITGLGAGEKVRVSVNGAAVGQLRAADIRGGRQLYGLLCP